MDSCIGAVPQDSDISGIGVRVAVYVQNLLSFVPAIWALMDGTVTESELASVETQATTILITAFAILISAMVEARTLGLNTFNANIVLDLSWMNNTNVFIYFILYIQHKSQRNNGNVQSSWRAWIMHVRDRFGLGASRESLADGGETGAFEMDTIERIATASPGPRNGTAINTELTTVEAPLRKEHLKTLFRRFVLVLGSIHLSIMSALGLWLWSNPRSFGAVGNVSLSENLCALTQGSMTIIGATVPLGSTSIRVASIMMYGLFLVPGLNLFLPAGLFLGLFIMYHKRQQAAKDQNKHKYYVHQWAKELLQAELSIIPAAIGLSLLLLINIIFIMNIELALLHNRHLQGITDKAQWTFGQTLTLLLLATPFRDLIEAILECREKRHRKTTLNYFKEVLLSAIQSGVNSAEIDKLVMKSDPNINLDDEFGDIMQHVFERLDERSVISLLRRGANTNINQNHRSAISIAAYRGHIEVVKLLLDKNVDVNIQDSIYGSALNSAINQGHTEIVKLLLDKGADLQGSIYESALNVAINQGYTEIVQRLMNKKENVNLQNYDVIFRAMAYLHSRE